MAYLVLSEINLSEEQTIKEKENYLKKIEQLIIDLSTLNDKNICK